MKIRGPYPLFNPLSISELGLQGLGTALQLYQAYQQGKAQDFARNAALTGQPATELPGGAIRHFLSDVTGGVVSPNEEINGPGAIEQQQILNAQAKNRMEQINTIARARGTLGPQAFAPGSPLGKQAQNLGLNLAGPTPIEKYRNTETDIAQKRLNAYEQANNPQIKIQTAGEEARARALAQLSPDIVGAKVGLAGAEASARANATLAVNASPAAVSLAYEKGEASGAGRVAGTANAYANMSIPQYEASHKSTFVDIDTLSRVQSGKVGDFISQPEKYQEIPVAKIPDLNKDKQILKDVENARKLINAHPEYFPDTTLANWPARQGIGLERGFANSSNASSDPNLKQFQQLQVDMDAYFRSINGRSPNATQLTLIGPTLIPSIGGSYHYGYKADSLSVANQKLDQFEDKVRGLWGGSGGEGGMSDSDASSAIDKEIAP